jgi:transcriptional antiterminator RfaH
MLTVQDWYLVQTKPGSERIAQAHLKTIVDRTLLPLCKTQVRQREHTFDRVSPMFPSYLFTFCSLAHASKPIRYTPGVRGIVRFGERAAVVPGPVMEDLIARCADGPLDLSRPALSSGSALKVVSGPFRELRAVFDCYLSGTDRVAVLLSLLNAERRVTLPASMVVAAE